MHSSIIPCCRRFAMMDPRLPLISSTVMQPSAHLSFSLLHSFPDIGYHSKPDTSGWRGDLPNLSHAIPRSPSTLLRSPTAQLDSPEKCRLLFYVTFETCQETWVFQPTRPQVDSTSYPTTARSFTAFAMRTLARVLCSVVGLVGCLSF